jgi:fermentation-respiration switch protein FrsA (DUF1100 family)
MVWLVSIVALVLLLLTALVRFYQPNLVFFPVPGEDITPATYRVPYTPLTASTSDGVQLRVWHLERQDAHARVVYFHGNGGNLSMWADILVGIFQRGFEVVAFDYRGYGVSTGTPSEQGVYRDVEAVLALVHDRLRRTDVPLIYWGRSLGTATAAYAASLRAPDGVVLESGFPTMRAVVTGNPVLWALTFLSSYEFPTAKWISMSSSPVLVMHGDSDGVIPYRAGQSLYERISNEKRFVTITGGDHNDPEPRDPGKYWAAITEFVASLSHR